MPTKRLVRPQEGRILFGVCAGLGQYFNMDPTLVRILWVLLSFVAGSGIMLYVILAIIMPSDGGVITASVPTPAEGAAPAGTSLGGEVVESVEKAIDQATTEAGGTGGGGSVA